MLQKFPPGDAWGSRGHSAGERLCCFGPGLDPQPCSGALSLPPPTPSQSPHDQVLPQIPLHENRVFEAFVS